MDTALIVELVWKSVLTSGAALALLRLLRHRTAAERSWIAHAGLLATLLLPLAVVLIPAWSVAAPEPVARAWTETVVAAPLLSDPAPTAMPEAAPVPASDAGSTIMPDALTALPLAVWLWGLPALLLLLTTLIAVARLFALRARASVLVDAPWLSALAHAQQRMGFKHGTALLVSDELTSPVSWGVMRPIILLNREAVEATREAEAIIAHELAHVARLDWAKLLIARGATALFWFNPLVWLLAREGHQLREEAADDAVLRSDVDDADYAALLVGAARHENKALLLAAHGVAPAKDSLKRRVTRVLDKGLSRSPARRGWATLCSAGAILLSAPLAALTPVAANGALQDDALAGLPQGLPQIAGLVPRTAVERDVRAVAVNVALGSAAESQADERSVAIASANGRTAIAIAPMQGREELSRDINRQVRAALGDRAEAIAVQVGDRASARASVSERELSSLRTLGISPDYARDVRGIGGSYATFSVDQLMQLRALGVSSETMRQWAALGYRNASHSQLMNMAVHGATPRYIESLAAVGYRNVPPGDLASFRIHGVTPGFIRRLQAEGLGNVSPAKVVEMKIFGILDEDDSG